MRRKANPKFDRRHFTQTANKTKAINLNYRVMRGGIRL